MPVITVLRLGWMPYRDVWKLQEQLLETIVKAKLQNGSYAGSSYLIMVEHPPVYTLGKAGKTEHILKGADDVAEVIRINRGGDITFHGPGQLVVYPILDLEQFFTDIKKYMRFLEEVVIRVLEEYSIKGERLTDATGVWLDADIPSKARKICAMGVRSSRWVTMHGLALNVNTDLQYFDLIIPCGITDKGVTSLQQELGHVVSLQVVADKIVRHFADVFQAEMIERDAEGYRL
jgi:lipoyl(octanoyl) transferase